MKWLFRRFSSYLKFSDGVLKRVAASDLHADGPVCQVEDLQQALLSGCRFHHSFLADTITVNRTMFHQHPTDSSLLKGKTHLQSVSYRGGISIISYKHNTLRVKSCGNSVIGAQTYHNIDFHQGGCAKGESCKDHPCGHFPQRPEGRVTRVMYYVGIGGVTKQE